MNNFVTNVSFQEDPFDHFHWVINSHISLKNHRLIYFFSEERTFPATGKDRFLNVCKKAAYLIVTQVRPTLRCFEDLKEGNKLATNTLLLKVL